jgi:RNA polymerase sigma-70 factor (ECF subfamily)
MDRLEQLRLRLLVVKCQIGDGPAWEELYRQFNPAIGYYLRRLIGDEHAADVQQEVWLMVVRNLARLNSPEAFVVWLYRIARSKAMALLGAKQKHVPLDEQTAREIESQEQEDFSAADAQRVHAALDSLCREHRDVLLLRFMEDLSYEQIAEVVGCGVGTIRSRVHYAKSALRRQLEKDHE